MTISNKIPFGVRDGVLVGVEDVESGLRCACVCPVCRRALQARKGDVVSHYFAHNPSDDEVACESALETAVHLMAKQILSEAKIATLPDLTLKEIQYDHRGDAHRMTEKAVIENRVVFDEVDVERQFGDMRPDLVCYVDGVPVLIEIFVTHKCDRSKIVKIREMGVAAVEIDLSGSQYTITEKELTNRLLNETKNKKWISHPDVPEIKRRLRFSLEDRIRAINKRIAQESRLSTAQRGTSSWPSFSARAKAELPRKTLSRQEYKERHFFCPSCRNRFSMSDTEAPYTAQTVVCTGCGAEVSTRRV